MKNMKNGEIVKTDESIKNNIQIFRLHRMRIFRHISRDVCTDRALQRIAIVQFARYKQAVKR